MRVGIVAKRGARSAVDIASEVVDELSATDVGAVVDEETRDTLAADADGAGSGDGGTVPRGVPLEALSECDLVVSVGGDGTFLLAAREAGRTPLLGINLGEVGFLNAVEPSVAVETVREVIAEVREDGSPRTRRLPRLVAAGPDWTLGPAVNEVVLQGPRRGHGGGLEVEVTVDGRRYTAGHADGVLVATPVGSSAYNLSEGGPLVHPAVDGLVVTVMAGDRTLGPLVVEGSETVNLVASGASELVAVADGLRRRVAEPPTTVEVRRGDEPLAIAEPSLDFFTALDKLD